MIGDRWGVTESETLLSYPCDDFVDAPALQAWRGVGVEAPAESVWPWVAQGNRWATAGPPPDCPSAI
jgi:hypothetical protein